MAPDLTLQLLPGLTLRNPLMVASSHLTSGEPALKRLSRIHPSAVTLKTSSTVHGGSGTGPGKIHVKVRDFKREIVGFYSDGPKPVEFLNLSTTRHQLASAKEHLPDSLLGISILQHPAEDYPTLARELCGYDYVEFNLKYTLRAVSPSIARSVFEDFPQQWSHLLSDIRAFIRAFRTAPVFIKLPREINPFIPSKEWSDLLQLLIEEKRGGARVGLIVANSLRRRIPPMFHDLNVDRRFFSELSEGVLTGPVLFFDTYDMIRRICGPGYPSSDIPIVASGGILTIQSVLDVMSAGATAVQLCSALDINSQDYYGWLLNQLSSLLDRAHLPSLQRMISSFHSERDWRISILKKPAFDFATDYSDHVKRIFERSRQQLITIVENAIQESSGLRDTPPPPPGVRHAAHLKLERFSPNGDAAEEPFNYPLRVFSHSGNVTAHAILTRLAHTTNRVYRTSSGLSAAFKAGVGWDIAAISYSHLLRKDTYPELCEPIFLGFLCDDLFKVVALHDDMARLTTLYHFGGSASLAALEYATSQNPNLSPELLRPAALSYLLFSWPDEVALLVKEPLASIYGLVAGKAIREVYTHYSATCLVASVDFLNTHQGDLPKLYRNLRFALHEAGTAPAELCAMLFKFRLEDDLRNYLIHPDEPR